ncbi:hypothetical protein [Kribbella catacumbae]|uniref:hypothetical protein n=1 Tax=Kribbella catacumbae TaxID=460086 RepID=UPI00039C778D|nr:hypothetical protein [Kribbella catacumbae]
MRGVTALTAVAVLLLSGACGNSPAPTSQEPTVTPGTSDTPRPTGKPATPPTPSSDPVEQAKADLANRLGVDPAQVTLVSSTEVTWPDGSLGCPKPGMHYTQALVPGGRIVLEANGTRYNYHYGDRQAPFLCTS